MSSQKSGDSGNLLGPIPVGRLKALLDRSEIPLQKYGDSPTVKHYTLWDRILEIFNSARATERVEGGLWRLTSYDVVLGPDMLVSGNSKGLALDTIENNDNYVWRIPVENKAQALHAVSWWRGVKLGVSQDGFYRLYLAPGNGYVGYHLEVDVEEDVDAQLLVVLDNSACGSRHSSTINLELGSNSSLKLYTIEKSCSSLYHYKHTTLGENSRVYSRILASGGYMTRLREDYWLVGNKGHASIEASTISWRNERLDLVINTIQKGSNTEGVVHTRGIVSGSSVVAHRGVAKVMRESVDASVDVESFLYLVSDTAKAYSVPVLEVDTGYVVSARHSTAVMTMPGDEEFYLRQRGLSREDILKLLSIGMIENVVDLENVDGELLKRLYL